MNEQVKSYERTLQETPTWAVAVVCFVLVVISIIIEHVIHLVEKWLTKKRKPALVEALEKVKAELMLLGFISLLLTMFQHTIASMCVPESVASSWHPCPGRVKSKKVTIIEQPSEKGRKLLEFFSESESISVRRVLATKGYDSCADKGEVALVSAYGVHQLHIFIFWLAVFHILYCIITLGLGRTKMRRWKNWEDETKTNDYLYYNDPERFRFTRDTSFGRRHLQFWSQSTVSLYIVSFFRQFFGSVTKVDYFALRHGFIKAHLAPESESKFDFRTYIERSLEEDFKVVVGISPIMWFFAVLFLLSNTYGWYSYLWLPFIPLVITLLVGTKLQMIITKMGLRIQERGDVIKGAPLVEPGDDLFWFNSPRLLLFLMHFVLFQNAFQLAFFAWSTNEFSIDTCFHQTTAEIAIRLSMGVLIQVLCSYVTLPLFALVTQMGTNMKPTIFNDRVAAALKNWHDSAKKHVKEIRQSEANTPFSSRPGTPTRGMSPVHLLHNYRSTVDSWHNSPRASNVENENLDEGGFQRPQNHKGEGSTNTQAQREEMAGSIEMPQAPRPIRTQHEIIIGSSEFSFEKSGATRE